MRKMLSKLGLLLLIGLVTVGIINTAPAGALQIVSVNLQELFAVHPAAREAQEQLQTEIMRLQQKLAEAENEETIAFMQQQMQQELEMLQQSLIQQALAAIIGDIERIAEERGYDYVVDSNTLIYGGEDITKEIKSEILED